MKQPKDDHANKRVHLSWSLEVWIFSIFCVLFLLLAIITLSMDAHYIIASMLVLGLLTCLALSPLAVSASSKQICIHRLISKRCFHLDDFDVYEIPKKCAKSYLRPLGNGGLFAIYGWFTNKDLDMHFRHTVSDKDLLLLVRKKDKRRYLINCPPILLKELDTEILPFSVFDLKSIEG